MMYRLERQAVLGMRLSLLTLCREASVLLEENIAYAVHVRLRHDVEMIARDMVRKNSKGLRLAVTKKRNGGLSMQGTGRLQGVTSSGCGIDNRLHDTALA